MKKKIFENFIRYNWWIIVLIGLVGGLLLGYIAKAKTRIRDEEIIHLFIDGSLTDSSFNKKYFDTFHKEDGIYQINTTAIPHSNPKYESAYKAIFGIDSDLVVVSESFLIDNDLFKSSVYKFSDEEVSYITSIVGGEIYKFKDYNIGVKIFDKNDDAYSSKFGINNYFKFDESSYLFIDKTSTNLNIIGFNNNNVTWNAFCNFIIF